MAILMAANPDKFVINRSILTLELLCMRTYPFKPSAWQTALNSEGSPESENFVLVRTNSSGEKRD